MSSSEENIPTGTDEIPTVYESDPTDPVDPPTTDPEPEPTPTPDAPPAPDVIAWEPRTWYSITYVCLTPTCPNLNVVGAIAMFYSNDGQLKNIRVIDSTCNKQSTILTATKLDPQPIEE
ncbi:hypothetical protein [Streptomyces sp. NPDC055105]|uniref:hypothetical protein n=1 Tax=Streptomyces sp. NPDC055105 TaxID=3365719 RepID=UPI0037CE151E